MIAALAVVLSVVGVFWVTPAAPAAGADLSKFDPGHIISDALFFDSGAMSEQQIQSFIESKVPNCQPGYICLKDWRDNSRTTAADAMCGAYQGAPNERASAIIYKVARACGINPQVILVTLQKEQGLVTHTWPSDWRCRIAMGQGCPDTAACDSQYYGFFNQVYGAAWQFKRYANPPGTSKYFTWYAPGKTWNVLFSPNHSCGSGPVFIQNQATANLYYYTPYQPNAASLRAGYGTGDGCSTYGNRNFYNYFTDWFGDPSIGVYGAIFGVWVANGSSGGLLGRPSAAESCDWNPASTNCVQPFRSGTIAWAPTTGAHYIAGSINDRWRATRSAMGLPVADEACAWSGNVGCSQEFQYGTIVWTPTYGVRTLGSGISAEWHDTAHEIVGFPTGDESCDWTVGTCVQEFQRGGIVWSRDAGTHYMGAGIYAEWAGRARGVVGFPTGDESCDWTVGTCVQEFQRGGIVWSRDGGTHYVAGAIWAAWKTAHPPVGPPLGDENCSWTATPACTQSFQLAAIHWTPSAGAVIDRR
jgi:hypothetical protein